MLKKTAIAAAVFAAALTAPANAQETFKLGGISTLSGPGAPWGMAIQAATDFVAEDWNAKGGVPIGGKTYKIAPIVYDDAYKPDQAVTAGNRLIFEDKVRFIIGPMGGAAVNAILPITTPNNVFTMSMGFTRASMRKEYPFSFRPVATTAEYSYPMLKWAVAKGGIKKVVMLGPNDDSGQMTAQDAVGAYKKLGVDARFEPYERSRIDFAPILTRVIADGADAIDTDGSPPLTAAQIIKQARELGFTGKFVHSGGEATAELVRTIGKEAIEGMFIQVGYDPKNPDVQALAQRYRAKYKSDMTTHVPVMYAATQMLIAALQKAGTVIDVAKVSEMIQQMGEYDSFVGKLQVTGKEQYDGVTRQILAPFYVGQVRNGVNEIMAKCSARGCE